ncbi:MAG: formylglycine-generating enzyme family protein [Puniceicoccaceae bacterium]
MRNLFAIAMLLVGASALKALTIDTVVVGNPGNSAQSSGNRSHSFGGGDGRGSVPYSYRISTFEVTNTQYVEFLNAVDPTGANALGLYSSSMQTDQRGGIRFTAAAPAGSKYSTKLNFDDKPVNFVTYYDAARFANWLTNGQGSGDTEDGAYTITAAAIATNSLVRNDFDPLLGNTATEDRWVLPNADEWFKAAFYNPTSGTYSLYGTNSNVDPTVATASATGDISNPGANVANYNNGATWNSIPGNVTTVGSAGPTSTSGYGAYDMAGNVWEWTEQNFFTSLKVIRGGALGTAASSMRSSTSSASSPTDFGGVIGIRLVQLSAVPEVSYAIFGVLLGLGSLSRRFARRGR